MFFDTVWLVRFDLFAREKSQLTNVIFIDHTPKSINHLLPLFHKQQPYILADAVANLLWLSNPSLCWRNVEKVRICLGIVNQVTYPYSTVTIRANVDIERKIDEAE